MAISLSDVKRNVMGPPRLLIYGVAGIGKTTLGACAPDAIWIPAEDGLAGLDVEAFPKPDTLDDTIACMQALVDEDHNYRWLVIDSTSAIGDQIDSWVVENVPHEKGHQVTNLEGYGYGKGLKQHVPDAWRSFRDGLDAIRAKGMGVILIGHNSVEKFEDPETDPYDRHQLAINRFAEPVIYDWCDAVLFLNYRVRAVEKAGSDRRRGTGTGERRIYTQERPGFKAKNRYRMPFEIELANDDPQAAWSVIEQCIGDAAGTAEKPQKPKSRKAKATAAAAE
ncbi:MAG: ATP-binding protein [Planctomycetes bacterium]|nr:ATP-binding protein [Planctomycetota bacterium]